MVRPVKRLLVILPLFVSCGDGNDIDAGFADVGAADAQVLDAGPVDTGPTDLGALDLGPADTGVADSGMVDTGPVDLGPPDMGADPTWEADIAPLFTTYCVACHDTGNTNRDYNLYADAFRDRSGIRCGVSPTRPNGCNGFPPPGQFPVGNGPTPSDAERLLIVRWVETGAVER